MRISRLSVAVLFLATFGLRAQECVHENLSVRFDFRTRLVYDEKSGISTISVDIIDKSQRGNIQTVTIKGEGFYADSFSACNSVRSYTTNVNDDLPSGGENDSGNLIVADFNFDGREDFALKRDKGGNGGPLYEFYVQSADKKFHSDKFLTDTMEFFPLKVDAKKKRLTTLVHANAYQMCKQVYQYDPKSAKWKLVSKSFE